MLAALARRAAPSWYVDPLDATGAARHAYLGTSAPRVPPPGVLAWEYAVPAAGSRFVADEGQGLRIWFWSTGPDGALTSLVANLVGERAAGRRRRRRGGPPGRRRPRAGAPATTADEHGRLPGRRRLHLGRRDGRPLAARQGPRRRASPTRPCSPSGRTTSPASPTTTSSGTACAPRAVRALGEPRLGGHRRPAPAWLAPDDPWVTVVPHRDGLARRRRPADLQLPRHRDLPAPHPRARRALPLPQRRHAAGPPADARARSSTPDGTSKFFWSRALVDHGPVATGEVASTDRGQERPRGCSRSATG